MAWRSGQPVTAQVRHLRLTGDADDWYEVTQAATEPVHGFDAVLMRKDPPFDSEFFYATHLLEQAEREGARVFNSPRALRDHPEKLALMEFARFAPPTLVTRSARHPRLPRRAPRHHPQAAGRHGRHGHFPRRRRRHEPGLHHRDAEPRRRHQRDGAALPARDCEGDKRLLLIGGRVAPFVLARIPQGGEVRGNLAAGGKGVAQPLSDDNRAVAEAIAPTLAARGLLLVGLDMIGNKVTEINVTSPTCFQEITDQTGFDVPAMFVDALEAGALLGWAARHRAKTG
jgi:glutathione synthase